MEATTVAIDLAKDVFEVASPIELGGSWSGNGSHARDSSGA
jgi:hypothetical protein